MDSLVWANKEYVILFRKERLSCQGCTCHNQFSFWGQDGLICDLVVFNVYDPWCIALHVLDLAFQLG